MFSVSRLTGVVLAAAVIACALPAAAGAQDRDTQEVQRYVLTDAALAKYKAATKKLATLPAPGCDEDDDTRSIADGVAKLDTMPAAKAAITSTGITTREYIVFSYSILHNGLASWALGQPGGKLPPGTSQANVDFYRKHAAEIESLPKRTGAACDDRAEEDG